MTFHSHGDAAKELAASTRTFKASYINEHTYHHIYHHTMEPMNCTATAMR